MADSSPDPSGQVFEVSGTEFAPDDYGPPLLVVSEIEHTANRAYLRDEDQRENELYAELRGRIEEFERTLPPHLRAYWVSIFRAHLRPPIQVGARWFLTVPEW